MSKRFQDVVIDEILKEDFHCCTSAMVDWMEDTLASQSDGSKKWRTVEYCRLTAVPVSQSTDDLYQVDYV